ncbi:TIGR02996 domain-containing protein [Corallococcus macrosporus]|uniref:Uncharacterized protein n=1 Tax=Myxococcus fulvus (strain ATCC BAA-855 / HW-1) TaxID=483219 RepID=F8CGY1_MYXFH|nr:TIGR02996 domain-containing protein [Corallococcus macrosporus]AEI63690.1 hypothetical protein LILAB_08895 [Corallococcus macrosporus]
MDELTQQLLAAVVAQPEEDAPRLVYADHLQQQGDPRGEFIAVQVALAAEPASPPRRAEGPGLGVGAPARRAWRAELGLNPRQAGDFRRGFIEAVTRPEPEGSRLSSR